MIHPFFKSRSPSIHWIKGVLGKRRILIRQSACIRYNGHVRLIIGCIISSWTEFPSSLCINANICHLCWEMEIELPLNYLTCNATTTSRIHFTCNFLKYFIMFKLSLTWTFMLWRKSAHNFNHLQLTGFIKNTRKV